MSGARFVDSRKAGLCTAVMFFVPTRYYYPESERMLKLTFLCL